jgi:hypothetical protein
MIDINQEAEEYAWKKPNPFSLKLPANELVLASKTDFIAGHNSKATQAKVIQGQIEMLNSLDGKLQAKYEILTNMQQEYIGKMKEGQLASKKSGLRLAKEEIKRDLKELQQQLKELENE